MHFYGNAKKKDASQEGSGKAQNRAQGDEEVSPQNRA